MKTTAGRCVEFLQSRGTTRNWQPVVMYNYGGRLLSYEGGPIKAIYNYRFDDGSCIDVHCSYKAEQRIVEGIIRGTVVVTIKSHNYMKF